MSEHELAVWLDEVPIGVLRRASRRDAPVSFHYDDVYRHTPGATPLSLSMPLTARDHRRSVVEPFLWGTLPDNGDVLDRWARDAGTTRRDLLGIVANVGADLPGALAVISVGSPLERDGVEWLSDAEVAELIKAVRADTSAWHPDGSWRWSLAGAQAKLALFADGRRWGHPHGRTPSNTILKPAITGLDDHDLNEHLCLAAARLLGLRTARSRIVSFGSERVVAVERYDRPVVDGKLRRLHQEDLCQALGVDPSSKYEAEGGPTVVQIADLLLTRIGGAPGTDALWRYVDALIFSWLVGAPDQHAKNCSLLLSGSQVRLAPLYDIASALPYEGAREDRMNLAARIGGTYRLDMIRAGSWRRLAGEVGLDPDAVIARALELAAGMSHAFVTALNELDAAGVPRDGLPERLVEVVSARAARCVSLLTGTSHGGR